MSDNPSVFSGFLRSQITATTRSYAIIGATFATILTVAIAIAGLYLLFKNDPYTADTDAIVINAICSLVPPDQTYQQSSCDLVYAYNVEGTSYASEINGLVTMKAYTIGQSIRIQYIPSQPYESRLYETPLKVVGGALLIVAACILLIGWGISWAISRTTNQT